MFLKETVEIPMRDKQCGSALMICWQRLSLISSGHNPGTDKFLNSTSGKSECFKLRKTPTFLGVSPGKGTGISVLETSQFNKDGS
jgi:hypothetical protein